MLKISDLAISYDSKPVLSGLSLHAAKGELTAILGASGAGKSTLLRLIAGFEKPDAGEIYLDGVLVADANTALAPEKRGIGIVPQDSALFSHLSVFDNVGFGLPKDAHRTDRVNELLDLVGLREYANRKPASLSGGQQQRVALARALAPKPKLILLDEPFSALDQELRARLREDVKRALRAEQATAILVTHDQEEALSLAEKVAVLRDGRIIQAGAPTEIYNSPADLGIATFLGDSVLVDGVVREGKVETALGKLSALNSVTEGEKGVVAIRSENFYLQPNPSGDSEVVGRVFFGHDAVVEVQTPKLKIRARSNGPFAPEVGMRVTVWVRGAVNFYPASSN
ncbi:MAG: ABC transporter ATP-binding protein [Actinobacteria bacterium]|nr:ABC transporter ATP-binding protein [Actinomycetota bacterium]